MSDSIAKLAILEVQTRLRTILGTPFRTDLDGKVDLYRRQVEVTKDGAISIFREAETREGDKDRMDAVMVLRLEAFVKADLPNPGIKLEDLLADITEVIESPNDPLISVSGKNLLDRRMIVTDIEALSRDHSSEFEGQAVLIQLAYSHIYGQPDRNI